MQVLYHLFGMEIAFNNAGTFVVHLTNSIGCDSAATLVLTTLSASSSTTNASTCSNQLPFIWNGNSVLIMQEPLLFI